MHHGGNDSAVGAEFGNYESRQMKQDKGQCIIQRLFMNRFDRSVNSWIYFPDQPDVTTGKEGSAQANVKNKINS